MKTESPYRKIIRLRKEIQECEKNIRAIETSAMAERVHLGFKKLGKGGASFSVKHSNIVCIEGALNRKRGISIWQKRSVFVIIMKISRLNWMAFRSSSESTMGGSLFNWDTSTGNEIQRMFT